MQLKRKIIMALLITLAVITVGVLLAGSIVWLDIKSSQKLFARLAKETGAVYVFSGGKGQVDGHDYQYFLAGGGRRPSSFHVKIHCQHAVPWEITNKNVLDNLGIIQHLNAEIGGLSASFMDKLVVSCSDTAMIEPWLRQTQDQILALFELNLQCLRCDGNHLQAVWLPVPGEAALTGELILNTVKQLLSLLQKLPTSSQQSVCTNNEKHLYIIWLPIALMGCIGVLALLPSFLYSPAVNSDFYGQMTVLSVISTLIYCMFGYRILIGKLRGKAHFLGLLLGAPAAFFAFYFGFVGVVNGVLDQQAAVVMSYTVQDKIRTKHNGSTRYQLVVSAGSSTSLKKISVHSEKFKAAQPLQTTLLVHTKPGFLGYPLIEKMEIVAANGVMAQLR